MYINPDYYLYEKIKELQTKVIRLTDELADANYTIKKLQQKEQKKCRKIRAVDRGCRNQDNQV